MAFKRKLPTDPVVLENFKGGAGAVQKFDVLTPEEMYNKGRVCSVMMLEPGSEVGKHRHEGDCEVYLILSGRANICSTARSWTRSPATSSTPTTATSTMS